MPMEIIPKEKMTEDIERIFFSAIVHIENIKEPRLNDEQRITLLSIYTRGVKNCISMIHGNIDRLQYIKEPPRIYTSGISDSIDFIDDMIENIDTYAEDSNEPIIDIFEGESDIVVARLQLLLTQIYIMGIGDIATLHSMNKLNEKIAEHIEYIDSNLYDYLAKYPKEPEEYWEKLRNRFGFKGVF